MDDIEILKLENKALRARGDSLEAEVKVLRRYRELIERISSRSKEVVRQAPAYRPEAQS